MSAPPVDTGGRDGNPYLPVVNVSHHPVRVLLLDNFIGVLIHWRENRVRRGKSIACNGPNKCHHCKRELPRRYGYAPAVLLERVGRILPSLVVLSVSFRNRDSLMGEQRGKAYRFEMNPRGYELPIRVVHEPINLSVPLPPTFSVLTPISRLLLCQDPADLQLFDWDTEPAKISPITTTTNSDLVRELIRQSRPANPPSNPVEVRQALRDRGLVSEDLPRGDGTSPEDRARVRALLRSVGFVTPPFSAGESPGERADRTLSADAVKAAAEGDAEAIASRATEISAQDEPSVNTLPFRRPASVAAPTDELLKKKGGGA